MSQVLLWAGCCTKAECSQRLGPAWEIPAVCYWGRCFGQCCLDKPGGEASACLRSHPCGAKGCTTAESSQKNKKNTRFVPDLEDPGRNLLDRKGNSCTGAQTTYACAFLGSCRHTASCMHASSSSVEAWEAARPGHGPTLCLGLGFRVLGFSAACRPSASPQPVWVTAEHASAALLGPAERADSAPARLTQTSSGCAPGGFQTCQGAGRAGGVAISRLCC